MDKKSTIEVVVLSEVLHGYALETIEVTDLERDLEKLKLDYYEFWVANNYRSILEYYDIKKEYYNTADEYYYAVETAIDTFYDSIEVEVA